MPFVSFGNEKNASHLNVQHIVSLELVEAPNQSPAVRIRATRAEADLTIPFKTKVEAQDLIDAVADYSSASASASFELVATAAAKPKLLPCAKFEADEPYEPGEQN